MKEKTKDLQKKKAIAGYLFIAPFIIGFLVFMLVPLVDSLTMAFSRVTIGEGGFDKVFIGIENFKKAFTVDAEFNGFLVDEITKMGTNTIATLIFSFFIGLILHQEFKCRGIVRAVFFLPVILSSGVILGLEYDNTLMQGMQDIIAESDASQSITATLESILDSSGIGGRYVDYIFEVVNNVYDIAIASGIQIIIFLSGMNSISSSMYEAAKIEGATSWESFWKVTFPLVSPLILVNVVYTIIDFFVRSDNTVMEKITTTMVNKLDYGFSSAMAWIYFVVVIAIIGVAVGLISRVVFYDE